MTSWAPRFDARPSALHNGCPRAAIFFAHLLEIHRMPLRFIQRCERLLKTSAVVLLVSAAPFGVADDKKPDPDRPVIGWIENIKLMDANIVQKARIDTGAGLASIDATIVRVIKSDDPKKPDRVVFTVEDGKSSKKTLEKDIVKWINIKKKGGKGFTPRPVVKLDICIAGKKLHARVNLADRHGFLYPALIGRNFLKMEHFLVDSRKTFTHDPDCK
jgi:hypothetical protein